MSVLLSTNEGWMLSHLEYLNKIYETVEDGCNIKKLKFNENIFKITSQYLRTNQIESNLKEDDVRKMKRKKSKNAVTLADEVLTQVRILICPFILKKLNLDRRMLKFVFFDCLKIRILLWNRKVNC